MLELPWPGGIAPSLFKYFNWGYKRMWEIWSLARQQCSSAGLPSAKVEQGAS